MGSAASQAAGFLALVGANVRTVHVEHHAVDMGGCDWTCCGCKCRTPEGRGRSGAGGFDDSFNETDSSQDLGATTDKNDNVLLD